MKNNIDFSTIVPQNDQEYSTKLVSTIHPAIVFLNTLPYREGDRVTGRNIPAIDGIGKRTDWAGVLTEDNINITEYCYGDKAYSGTYHHDGIQWLNQENEYKGIYFNVNGGRNNASVTEVKAVVWESDRGSHEEQARLNALLPIPLTAAVKTKRSTHSYLGIIEECRSELERWKKELEPIAAYTFTSDPAIKDLPRLMRLPGFDHVKESEFQLPGEPQIDYVPCELITSEPDNVYSLDTILDALKEVQKLRGLKPYSKERFLLYQYINGQLNLRKYKDLFTHEKFNPEIAQRCDSKDISELATRSKLYARLVKLKAQEIECDEPDTAWTCTLKKARKLYKKECDFDTVAVTRNDLNKYGVLANETINETLARKYGEGFTPVGEQGARELYHTCQCPVHGSSTGATDNLHIKASIGSNIGGYFVCQSGCPSQEIENAFRQIAKDAGDQLWNSDDRQGGFSKVKKTKGYSLKQLEEIHKKMSSIDVNRCREMGIAIRYLDTPSLTADDYQVEPNKITIMISPKGSCKTRSLIPIVKAHNAVYAQTHRISLARSTAEGLGLTYHEDSDTFQPKITYCAPSNKGFHPRYISVKKGLHIGDEIDQQFSFMFSSLCNQDNSRPIIFKAFEAHMEAALLMGSAIYLSADIFQRHIGLIKELASKHLNQPTIEVVINEFKPKLCELHFDTSDNPTGLIKVMVQKLRDGIPCFAIDDFKNGKLGGKSLAEHVIKEIPELADKVKIINSETAKIEAEYIKHINTASMDTMLLICSPSITSGVSIENGRFVNGVFGFFNGILRGSEASQSIARVRGANAVYVWAAEQGVVYEESHEFTPEEVNSFHQEKTEYRNSLINTYNVNYDVQSEEWTSPWWKLYCEESAQQNIEVEHLRHFIRKKLVADGYDVRDVEYGEDEALEEALGEIWENMELSEAEAIATATEITKEQFDALVKKSRNGDSLTKEEQEAIAKYRLKNLFGEDLINAAKHEDKNLTGYAAMYVLSKENRSELVTNMFNYYRAFHLTTEEVIANDLRPGQQQQAFYGTQFVGDIRSNFPQKYWAEKLNLKQFADPNKKVTVHDFQELIDAIKADVKGFEQAFGFKVTEKTKPGTLYRFLVEYHGLKFGDDRQQIRVNGVVTQCWQVTKESFEFAEAFSHHQKSKKASYDTVLDETVDFTEVEGVIMPPIKHEFVNNTGDMMTANENNEEPFGFPEDAFANDDQLSTLRYRADKFILVEPTVNPEGEPAVATTATSNVIQLNLLADLDIAA